MKKMYMLLLLVNYIQCAQHSSESDLNSLVVQADFEIKPIVGELINQLYIVTHMCKNKRCQDAACHQGEDYCHMECTSAHKARRDDTLCYKNEKHCHGVGCHYYPQQKSNSCL